MRTYDPKSHKLVPTEDYVGPEEFAKLKEKAEAMDWLEMQELDLWEWNRSVGELMVQWDNPEATGDTRRTKVVEGKNFLEAIKALREQVQGGEA